MFNWIKSLFGIKPTMNEAIWQPGFTSKQVSNALDKQAPKKRPRLYKQATVVTTGELPKPKEKKMPLKKGTSNATRQKNIATEIKAGKKPAQAVAIGYAVQREAKKTATKTAKKAK